MPRRKKRGRKVYKPRKLKVDPNIIVIPLYKVKDDGISPGKLRAVAEWR